MPTRISAGVDDSPCLTTFYCYDPYPVLTCEQQLTNPIISELHSALSHGGSGVIPQGCKWCQPPYSRYKQLWSQLSITDGLICHCYAPNPQLPAITVPLIPASQRLSLIKQQHDAPSAGHFGYDKTVSKVRQLGYWVGMLQDIDKYCRECIVCQRSKPPAPNKTPLINVPIGKPWQMVAVDSPNI